MAQSDHKLIYESPDGGKTVYARIGDARINRDDVTPEWLETALERAKTHAASLREDELWRCVVAERHRDADIAMLLYQAKALYLLRREEQ